MLTGQGSAAGSLAQGAMDSLRPGTWTRDAGLELPAPSATPGDPLANCMRDIDFARSAAIKNVSDLRRRIRKVAADGEMTIVEGLVAAETPLLPLVYAVVETVSGNTTTVYCLAIEAQRVMAQRLATPKAALRPLYMSPGHPRSNRVTVRSASGSRHPARHLGPAYRVTNR